MRVDVKKIKDNLTLDDYDTIITELGIPITQRNDDTWRLKSMCHAKDEKDCDSNLVFYTNERTFTCFSHQCIIGGDIFELIKVRQGLFYNGYTFIDAVNFLTDTLGIDKSNYKVKVDGDLSWRAIVSRYHNTLPYDITEPIIYNEDILNGFPKLYYSGWLSEGISKDSMSKYEIAYYPTRQAIVIPCRDIDNNLIGIRGRFFDEYGKYRPIKLLSGEVFAFPSTMFFYGELQNKNSIKRHGKVVLVEGEKSVLKSDTWYGDDSYTLALYGKTISNDKIKKLVQMGVSEVIIGIDYDYHEIGDEQSLKYKSDVLKMAKKLKTYFTVSVMFNNQYEGYKYSPFDFDKNVYEELYRKRVRL